MITAREDKDSDEYDVFDFQLAKFEFNHLSNNRVLIEDIIASMVPRKHSQARKKVLVPLLKTAAKI